MFFCRLVPRILEGALADRRECPVVAALENDAIRSKRYVQLEKRPRAVRRRSTNSIKPSSLRAVRCRCTVLTDNPRVEAKVSIRGQQTPSLLEA